MKFRDSILLWSAASQTCYSAACCAEAKDVGRVYERGDLRDAPAPALPRMRQAAPERICALGRLRGEPTQPNVTKPPRQSDPPRPLLTMPSIVFLSLARDARSVGRGTRVGRLPQVWPGAARPSADWPRDACRHCRQAGGGKAQEDTLTTAGFWVEERQYALCSVCDGHGEQARVRQHDSAGVVLES